MAKRSTLGVKWTLRCKYSCELKPVHHPFQDFHRSGSEEHDFLNDGDYDELEEEEDDDDDDDLQVK